MSGATKHRCAAKGCNRPIPVSMLMCFVHWKRVPRTLQRNIWSEYRIGQESDGKPISAAYYAAVSAAVEAVWASEGHS